MKNSLSQLFLLFLFALAASAATDNLAIKPGLWETTMTSQSQGPPPISAAQKAEMEKRMAQMSPEMRARIEAAQKKSQASQNQPHTSKSCVTKEDLSKPMAWDNGMEDKCTRTILKSTPTVQEVRVECASDKYKSTAVAHFQAANSENVTGTMDSTITPTGGAPMTIKMSLTSKWLGADCGAVKPRSQK